MNDPFETKELPAQDVMELAFEKNGGGINEGIPMTLRPQPALSRKQRARDSQIVKELVYLCDVANDKDRAVNVFFENKHRLSDPCFWEILRTMWIVNGKRENLLTFRRLFQLKRPFKLFIMTIEEENAFKELPDPVIAYRATAKVGDVGISWTLNHEFVERYAKAQGREIVERQFPKSRITAYFNRRGEQEIIVL